jgi:hypothetical protein
MLTSDVIKTASNNYFIVVTLRNVYKCVVNTDKCVNLNKLVCFSNLCTMFNPYSHSLPMSQKWGPLLKHYNLKQLGMTFMCSCKFNRYVKVNYCLQISCK